MINKSRTGRLLLPAALALVLVGCGATVVDAPAAETVVVPRCAEPVEYRTPQRVIAYEGGSADKLFALGLADKVHGYVMPPANPDVSESPWAADYARTRLLSTDLLNKELVVKEKGDMVVAGWNSGFSEQRGITPEILDGLAVQSFMHSETCYTYPGFPERTTPFEGLYTDLHRLGMIFGVEERADAYVTELRDRVAAVEQGVEADRPRPRVFLYDSGEDQPSTAGGQAPPSEIMQIAGGQNIYADLAERWTRTSWESVVEADPQVIMILDYQDKPAEQKIAFLKSHPALKEIPAVKHDRFFVLDYNEGISGPRIVDGAERFGDYLRTVS